MQRLLCPGAPKFFLVVGPEGSYLSSKHGVPPVRVRGRGIFQRNFGKKLRLLGLSPTLFKLLGFRASEPPPPFLSHATPIMKLSFVVYRTIK